MASVNKVILLGRLGRDPETRYASEGGTAICHLALATSRRYKDRDGNRKEDTEWHNVVVFGRQAVFLILRASASMPVIIPMIRRAAFW